MEREELKKVLVDLHTAVIDAAHLHVGLRYRIDVLEQVTLSLLAELATHRPAAAAAIGGQVRLRAQELMERRQGDSELKAQQSMLDLLNNVLAAAGLQPGPRSDGG